MATVMKTVNAAFLKNKREWDLANLRAKKTALKKMESVRPSWFLILKDREIIYNGKMSV